MGIPAVLSCLESKFCFRCNLNAGKHIHVQAAPSPTEQYEHARAVGIPWMVTIEAARFSATDTVVVRRPTYCAKWSPTSKFTSLALCDCNLLCLT